jgi:aerobic-type carbon monoxide dehydrogenase small subunit (CoxS/CutS family)
MWLNINGANRMFMCDPEKDSLAAVLRRMGLTGVKVGCGKGACGACSVILDGKVVRSCARKIRAIPEYSKVLTIEGIGTPQHLHPLQVAWMNCGAVQCGFCVPGFIVSAYALLQENPSPGAVLRPGHPRPEPRLRGPALAAPGAGRPMLRGDDLRDMDTFLARVRSHGFTVTAMAFQDAGTLDLERLRRCSLHVFAEGRMVPFCARYLTGWRP